MKNYITLKLERTAPGHLMLYIRISITISGILLFLVWLMFLTKNFYPKSEDNLAAVIMNWPIQASIWPITLILLFTFVLPVWATQNFEILVIFLLLSIMFVILNAILLIFLNISSLWILWIVVDVISFLVLVFSLISISFLAKKADKK